MPIDSHILPRLSHQAEVCTERFSLPLRTQVWKGMAGEFQGAGTGSSIDFQDHRAYVPGDDPRHINWQAYARTGNYSMKLYREEVRPVIDVVLDVSESMFFDPVKAARTAELFYFAVISSIQAGASASIHLLKGNHYLPIPLDAVTSHRWPDLVASMTPTLPDAPLAIDLVPFRGNAIRVLISDLLFEADPTPILRHLSQQQGKPILFAPYLDQEVNPNWQGNYEFINAEHPGHHPHRIEPGTLKRYQKAYTSHFAQWMAAARRFNAPLARVTSNSDLLSALSEEAPKSRALSLT